jgi:nucleoside-diphosphate-sugar epimerase
MSGPHRLVVFGLGYTGGAIAARAVAEGWQVSATSRDPSGIRAPAGVRVVAFDHAAPVLAEATHLLATAPPGEAGDPVLARYRAAIAAAPHLRWAGYLSTTGVYGDRGGAWVDESTPPAPASERTVRRVAVERDWARFAGRMAVDVFRVAGIYGPGRSSLEDVRAGTARRVLKPGHAFGRIHRDDIARAVLAAAGQGRPPGLRVLHLVDDEPAETAAVIEEAARLLGVPPPPAVPFEQAVVTMNPMARSFWAENRKVGNAKTKAALGIAWLYPTYREGLRAILAGGAGGAPV